MNQVTIYLDDDALNNAKAAAQSWGMSLSKWIAEQIRRGRLTDWPVQVRELAGAWSDPPSTSAQSKSA